jgi:hypothetical protein
VAGVLLLSEAQAGSPVAGSPWPPPGSTVQAALLQIGRTDPEPDARIDAPEGRKSPAVAGALSLFIPGAGQFYNGQKIGYLFLGVEAAAWIAYGSMRTTGRREEEQYRDFADAHWSFLRYRDPTFEDCPTVGHSDGGVQDSTLMFLYDTRPGDFYEDIGKLLIYSCGWDTQANRDIYLGMREHSNDFLRRARYATTVVFLNHLVSAIHAARGAAGHNARLKGGTELKLGWSVNPVEPGASLALVRRF